jgi:kinetochore protein Nuf2
LFILSLHEYSLLLLHDAGMPHANLRDLMFPNDKSVKLQLSGLINFARFREQRMETFQQFSGQTDELLDLKQHLEESIAQLQPQVDALRESREAELPEIQRLKIETSAKEAKIAEFSNTFTAFGKENRALKTQINAANEQISHAKFQLLNMQQKVDKIRVQVVRSPEKLKSSLKKMAEDSASLVEEIHTTRTALRNLNIKGDALNKLKNHMNARSGESDLAIQDFHKKKVVASEISGLDAEAEICQEKVNEGERVVTHLGNQIQLAQDKLAQLSEQFENKTQAATFAMVEVNKQKSAMEREHTRNMTKKSQQEALIAQKQAQMEASAQSHNEEMNALRSQYAEFGEQVKEYHKVLLSSFSH